MSGSAREPAGYCASLVEIGRFVVCRWEFCPWSLRDVELSSAVVGQSSQLFVLPPWRLAEYYVCCTTTSP